jgi:group I intron endonuclease
MAVVYLHRRMDTNEVFYVGIGMYKKRAYDKNKRNRLWKNVVNKCKDYEVEILHENITYQECKLIEIDLIDKYGRKDLGTGTLCNLTDGGDGTVGWIVSDETRRKISEGKTGEKHYFYGKTHSDETLRKMSERKTGEKHPMFGKTHSDESRIKIGEAQKGRKHSEESRRKMSEGKTGEKHNMFGKTPSEETRRKMSEAQKGKKHSEESLKKMRESAKGRKLSEETIRKMRETRRKNKENLDN